MIKMSLIIEKVRKSIIETIILLIGIISFVLTSIYLQLPEYRLESFIFGSITVSSIIGLYSIAKYKKEISDQSCRKKYLIALKILWGYSIWLSAVFIFYKIYFGKNILHDKYYWIYKVIILYIIISIILKYIINFFEKIKELTAKKAKFYEHCLNVLATVWLIFFLNNYCFYWFYTPKKVLNLSNAPKPCYLPVYEHKHGKWKLFSSTKSKEIMIEDGELLESFMGELSKAPVENIRSLDYMNYDVRAKHEIYYLIMPDYKDSYGNSIRPRDFDKMLFTEMRLHKNGELVLVKYDYDYVHNFPFFINMDEMYRVNLSLKLTNQILELFDDKYKTSENWEERNL